MKPFIKTRESTRYGKVKFRLIAVLDSFELQALLQAKGFPDEVQSAGFQEKSANTLAEAMGRKDAGDVKHNLIQLINSVFPTHQKLWCKHEWSFALFVPILEDNKDWDGSNTEYAKDMAELNRPVKQLPIGVKQALVDRFLKKNGEFFSSLSFASEEEILAYLNRNYGVEPVEIKP